MSAPITTLELPHSFMPKQAEFIDSQYRYTLYSGGVGSGKTLAGCYKAIEWALTNPKSLGLIGTQTYPQLRDTTYRTFKEIINNIKIPIISDIVGYDEDNNVLLASENISRFVVKFINGSEILFRTLDNESKIRGSNLSFFYIDEATTVRESIWRQLTNRIRVGEDCQGFITTNPDMVGHWIYKLFIEQPEDLKINKRNYHVIYASSNENYNLPKSYLEDLNSYDDDYKARFVDGKWGITEGLVYKSFDNTKHVIDMPIYDSNNQVLPKWKSFYRGIDQGHTNPMACVYVAVDNDDHYHIFDEYYQAGVDIDINVENITELHKSIYWDCTYVDPSAVDTKTFLKRDNRWVDPETGDRYIMRIKDGNNTISGANSGVYTIIRLFREGKLTVSPKCKNLIKELLGYKWMKDRGTDSYIEKPEKVNDHAVDALRYILHTINSVKKLIL